MIAVGCDHAGFPLKQAVLRHLTERGLSFIDAGAYDEAPSDYPLFANAVADKILSGEAARGILICGTGIGVSIAANRHHGVHAALCHDAFSARACRLHNNANILCLGARVVGEGLALDVLDAFLDTNYEDNDKRRARVAMYD